MKTWGFGKVLAAKSRRLYLRPAKFNFSVCFFVTRSLHIRFSVLYKTQGKVARRGSSERELWNSAGNNSWGRKKLHLKGRMLRFVSPMSYPETVLNDLINHACLPSKSLKEPIEQGLVTLHICREHRGQNSILKFNEWKSIKRWQFWSYFAHSARYCSVERESI